VAGNTKILPYYFPDFPPAGKLVLDDGFPDTRLAAEEVFVSYWEIRIFNVHDLSSFILLLPPSFSYLSAPCVHYMVKR